MFRLALLEDQVRVCPSQFGSNKYEALELVINQRYCDKVIPGVGLCLGFFDWVRAEEGRLVAGDGASYTKCRFRMVVFEPFVGEVITGRIASCGKETGLRVSLEFFQDVIVEPSALPKPSQFVDTEGVWVWKFEGSELFMDCQEPIRVKVTSVTYSEIPEQEVEQIQSKTEPVDGKDPEVRAVTQCMEVHGMISEDGLGLVSWWDT